MKNAKKKHNDEKLEDEITKKLTAEVENKRYEEAEEVLKVIKDYPGSNCEELMMLSGYCGNCFKRRMSWLKINELIEFDGEYCWAVKEE